MLREDTLSKKNDNHKSMALFDMDEITLGNKLGAGGFNDVYEIKSFQPNNDNSTCTQRSARRKRDNHKMARNALMRRVEEEDEAHYALKFVRKKEDKKAFHAAVHDLSGEARLLSSINHPNIVRIHGWAIEEQDRFFIILDRVAETLKDRVVNKWKGQDALLRNPLVKDFVDRDGVMRRNMFLERLKIAQDIAGALEYLHERGIVYRDLKPGNIGLDHDGRAKILDFGLARKMPKKRHDYDYYCDDDDDDYDDDYDVFTMSGEVGTTRYMAPEVHLRQPYNTKVDVFSFSLVLWEMLALEKPYASMSCSFIKDYVVGRNRPSLHGHPTWPQGIKRLLTRAWHPAMTQRPAMREIRKILEAEIVRSTQQPHPSTNVGMQDEHIDDENDETSVMFYSSPETRGRFISSTA